jgi:hypothetical protein
MLRSSIAPIAVAALTLLTAGACNRPQTPAPTQRIDAASLMKSLGTASMIPLQLCSGFDALPLHMAVGPGQSRVVTRPLRVSMLVSSPHRRVSCVPPPDIQQDNAVPLTRVNSYVEF